MCIYIFTYISHKYYMHTYVYNLSRPEEAVFEMGTRRRLSCSTEAFKNSLQEVKACCSHIANAAQLSCCCTRVGQRRQPKLVGIYCVGRREEAHGFQKPSIEEESLSHIGIPSTICKGCWKLWEERQPQPWLYSLLQPSHCGHHSANPAWRAKSGEHIKLCRLTDLLEVPFKERSLNQYQDRERIA